MPQVNPIWSWWLVRSCTVLWNANHESLKILTSTFLRESEQKVFFVVFFSSAAISVILALLFIKGAVPLFLYALGPFLLLGPLFSALSALLAVNTWPGGLFPFDLAPGKGPSEGRSHQRARTSFPAGRQRIGPTGSLLSLKTVQQINCSCALEFPQHTNLHDVKQLGGNPSMPRTEAELPMSYGD